MKNYLHEISPEMTKTVDDLKQRNFANATPNEIEVYTRWSVIQALQDDEIAQERERREKELSASIEQSNAKAESAINALNALASLANEKLKAVQNGQE